MSLIDETNEIPYKWAKSAKIFTRWLNPFYTAVKYASLMYGIRAMVGDDVDVGKIITAGVFYTVASYSNDFIKNESLEAQLKIIEKKIDH